MNDIQIRSLEWLNALAARDIRQSVFIDEQQVPVELEWDEQDAQAIHFLMLAGDQPVGTARLLTDGHIGRVAIVREWRGKGLGERLMRHIIEHARQRGHDRLILSAQVHALDFYQRLGFAVSSDEYLDAGILHRDMVWRDGSAADILPPIEFSSPGRFDIHNPESSQRPRYASHLPHVLGEHSELIEVDDASAHDHLCALALQTRRSLNIYAADQALWLFNRRDVIDCCEQLIAAQPKCRIRILLHEASQEFLQGHSLLDLMHRFPSFCEIRRQHPDLPREPQVYMLADSAGLLMLPRAILRNGFVRYDSRDQVKRWGARFDELWASSQSDPATRRFLL